MPDLKKETDADYDRGGVMVKGEDGKWRKVLGATKAGVMLKEAAAEEIPGLQADAIIAEANALE